MAHIKKIRFNRTGKEDGCLCDKCGQYIRNIWTVDYTDGVTLRFGIDCYEKLNKESGLTTYGQKLLKKATKRIEDYTKMFEAEKALTEETDIHYQNLQNPWDYESKDYWYGKPWEDYHEWMLNEWFPARFADADKEIAKFAKVNFKR